MSPKPLAQHTVEAPIPPKAVWALWSDPIRWKAFYPGLDRAVAVKGLRPGATLELRQAGEGAPQRYEIVVVEAGTSFTLLRRLPFARLRLLHRVDPAPLGCRIHLRLDLEGPLAWLYGLARGRAWRQALPPLLRALAKAAQT